MNRLKEVIVITIFVVYSIICGILDAIHSMFNTIVYKISSIINKADVNNKNLLNDGYDDLYDCESGGEYEHFKQ